MKTTFFTTVALVSTAAAVSLTQTTTTTTASATPDFSHFELYNMQELEFFLNISDPDMQHFLTLTDE